MIYDYDFMHMITHDSARAHVLVPRSPVPGPVMFVRILIFSGVWCVPVRRVPFGRVPCIFGAMGCYGAMIWYDMSGSVIWNLLEYDVVWRHRQAGDHRSKSLCMIYILLNILTCCILYLLSVFHYYGSVFLLYILSTYSVLTPFLRGLRFMPAGTDAQFEDPPT